MFILTGVTGPYYEYVAFAAQIFPYCGRLNDIDVITTFITEMQYLY